MKINKKIIVLLLTITVNLIISSDDITKQIDGVSDYLEETTANKNATAKNTEAEPLIENLITKITTATRVSPEAKLKSFEELRIKLKSNFSKAIEANLEAAESIPISDLALKKALSPATSLDFLADSFTKQRIKNELRMTQLYLIQEKVRSTFGSNPGDITIDKIKDLLKNNWKDDLGLAEVFDEYKDVVKEEIIKNIKVSKYTKELIPKILSIAKEAVITDEAVVLAKKSVATSDKAAGIIQKAVRIKQERVKAATENLISESPETELIAQVKKAILDGETALSEEQKVVLKKYLSKTGVTQEAFVKDLQLAEVANYKKIEDKMASISDLNDKDQEGLLEKLKVIAKKTKLSNFTQEDKAFLKEIDFDDDFLVEKSLATFKKVYNDKIESLYREAKLSIPEIDPNTKLLKIDDKAISALKKQQKFKIENQKFEQRFTDIAKLNFNDKEGKDQFKKLKAITKDSTKENLKAIDLDSAFVDSLTQEQLDSFKTLSVKLYNQAVAKLHSNLDLKPSLTVKQTAEQIFMRKKPITQFDEEMVREAQARVIQESKRQLELKKTRSKVILL